MFRKKGSPSSGPDWKDCWETLDELFQDGYREIEIRLVPGKNIIGEPIFTWEIKGHGMDRVRGRQCFLDRMPTSSASAVGGLYTALHRAWESLEEKGKR